MLNSAEVATFSSIQLATLPLDRHLTLSPSSLVWLTRATGA
jgi:hypothetical protein